MANATLAQPNTQGAAGTTTPRKRPRTPRGRRKRSGPGVRVSGARSRITPQTTVSTMWMAYGSRVGAGPHCAITPDTAGPRPKPAVRVREARRAATGAAITGYGGADSSLIQLLPTTIAAATLAPETSRPAVSSGKEAAPR